MKLVVAFCFLFSTLHITAQEGRNYADLLNTAAEVQLSDSLHINAIAVQSNRLDSITVKKWFGRVLPRTAANRLKNRAYYLTGKITSHDNFDLLVLLEEKKRNDSTAVQVVYLVSVKKDGNYIASIEAAVAGTRKRSTYNTSSWLYKDYKVVLDSKITVNEKSFDDLTSYKINGGGRFILYPRSE